MGGSSATDVGQNPLLKALITGPAVLGEMLSGGLFVENMKIEKQRTSHSYFRIMKRIIGQGLIEGFWNGFLPWGFILGMTKGIVLGGSRSFFINFYTNKCHFSNATSDILSGFSAGAVQGIFMSPIILARVRLLQDLENRSMINQRLTIKNCIKESFVVLNKCVKNEGLIVLTNGMPQMVLKRTIDWGSRFVLMRYCREYIISLKNDNYKLTTFDIFLSTFIGGSLSVFITMPIDRLLPIILSSKKRNKSVYHMLKELYLKEGFTTLQRGFIMRLLHCGIHTTFAIFLANQITNKIQKKV